MIINIPLQIDEKVIEKQLSVDYEKKIENYIIGEITQALLNQCGYYGNKTETRGMTELVKQRIDLYLENMRDDIIEAAADRLADRLARTKKAKELIKE